MSLSIEEMQHDLMATARDVHRLEEVVDNLRLFITDSNGEDRPGFRLCLMKCEVALNQGRALIPKITDAIAKRMIERITERTIA